MENLPVILTVVFVGGGFFTLTNFRLNQFENRFKEQKQFNQRIESKVDKLTGLMEGNDNAER